MVSRVRPLPGSNRGARASPESTTAVTPSTVRLLSAISVLSTTFRIPAAAGATARSCSSSGKLPCSGCTSTRGSRPRSCSWVRRISAIPGRKTRTSPSSSVSSTHCTACTTAGSNRSRLLRGRQCIATSNVRPAHSITGAGSDSPISAATLGASIVADMTITAVVRSSVRWASSNNARPKSACWLRSWNSSKMTRPYPSSSGSRWSRRVRMPSVTTSMRVALLTRRSSRVVTPTVCPTCSPNRDAIRAADARAANRRGSSMTMR